MPTKIEEVTLYSVPELSNMLNVTIVSIRNYIKKGYLKGQKLTGRWFISEESLKDFLDSLTK